MPNQLPDIETIVRDFATRLQAAVAAETADRARAAVASAFGGTAMPKAKIRQAAPEKEPAAPVRRKLKLSAKGLAARQLQGQYMGLLRGLPQTARDKVKKHAQEHGVAAALKLGKTLK
jgi:hypothetical protein